MRYVQVTPPCAGTAELEAIAITKHNNIRRGGWTIEVGDEGELAGVLRRNVDRALSRLGIHGMADMASNKARIRREVLIAVLGAC